MTAAQQVAQALGASEDNPFDSGWWQALLPHVESVLLGLIDHLGDKPLFTVRVLFIRKTFYWRDLKGPIQWAFHKFANTDPPTLEQQVRG